MTRSRTNSVPATPTYTYEAKYGIRDYRGGGRSSARETAMRVAAGAIARKVLGNVIVRGALVAMGAIGSTAPNGIGPRRGAIRSSARMPTRRAQFEAKLDAIRKSGSSIGAVIEIVAENVPAGWGAPIYGKLDAELAAALMSINAVKGVEIGDGFAAAALVRRRKRRRDAHRQ